ncbi:hypothetical protein [Roseomonas sp. BN140053]|uniref:hypothetical protein n=1 Tax=Roseomonas sp. BN140053 TaxID=3391898 RepID=UPI0039E7D08C
MAKYEDQDAERWEQHGAAALEPFMHTTTPLEPGRGGEMVAATAKNLTKRRALVDTVRERPDMLAADASLERLHLAERAGVLTTAVDAAETIQAENSLERMLAHQMAAAHSLAMTLVADGQEELQAYRNSGHRHPHRSQEAARMVGAAARLMDTFNRSLLTLERLRNGGEQRVVVQYVTTVEEGGQAVVGPVVPGRGSGKKGAPKTR